VVDIRRTDVVRGEVRVHADGIADVNSIRHTRGGRVLTTTSDDERVVIEAVDERGEALEEEENGVHVKRGLRVSTHVND